MYKYLLLLISFFIFSPIAFADQLAGQALGDEAEDDWRGNNAPAQPFTVSADGNVDSLTISVCKQSPTTDGYWKIYDDNGGVPDSLLATSDAITPAEVSGCETYTDITKNIDVDLATGETYWIVLDYQAGNNGSDAYRVNVCSDTSDYDPYSTGDIGAWSSNPPYTFCNFSVDGTFDGGGGGEPPATSTASTTVDIDLSNIELFLGILLFLWGMWFPVWLFKKSS